MKKILVLLCLMALYDGLSQTKTVYEKAKNELKKHNTQNSSKDGNYNTNTSSLETTPTINQQGFLAAEKDTSSYHITNKDNIYTKKEGEVLEEDWYKNSEDKRDCEDFWDAIFMLQGKKQL
ncbi:hypothetical protein B4N84_06665 [Flavobacterium sp. IR1]|nr:hypothetical protein B4N84_06665 [Flavobacterium sp. IR1]